MKTHIAYEKHTTDGTGIHYVEAHEIAGRGAHAISIANGQGSAKTLALAKADARRAMAENKAYDYATAD